jgi:hypothetical protein
MTKSSHHLAVDPFARRLASRLDEGTRDLPHDISERLRAARTRATGARLVQAPALQAAGGIQIQNGVGMLHFGDEGLSLWSRIAAFLPLIALVAGLVCVKQFLDDAQADQLAEVDAALLTDDLPPAAYADPGFLQFLKIGDTLTSSSSQD